MKKKEWMKSETEVKESFAVEEMKNKFKVWELEIWINANWKVIKFLNMPTWRVVVSVINDWHGVMMSNGSYGKLFLGLKATMKKYVTSYFRTKFILAAFSTRYFRTKW